MTNQSLVQSKKLDDDGLSKMDLNPSSVKKSAFIANCGLRGLMGAAVSNPATAGKTDSIDSNP